MPRKVNILVPMAGRGSRFAKVGFLQPKPLIDVAGKARAVALRVLAAVYCCPTPLLAAVFAVLGSAARLS
jgi:CTP:molybdopterin cytidylyltransferase MocA